MNKRDFIYELQSRLRGEYTRDEIDRVIDFYEELINDRKDNGESERDIIASFGTINEVIASIKDAAIVDNDSYSVEKDFVIEKKQNKSKNIKTETSSKAYETPIREYTKVYRTNWVLMLIKIWLCFFSIIGAICVYATIVALYLCVMSITASYIYYIVTQSLNTGLLVFAGGAGLVALSLIILITTLVARLCNYIVKSIFKMDCRKEVRYEKV